MKTITSLLIATILLLPVAHAQSEPERVPLPVTSSQSPERDRALVQAAFDGNLGAVKAAVAKGASLEATAPKGRTSMHWAAVNGHLEIIEFLHGEGANIDAGDSDGKTPLMFAIKGKHAEVVAFLLEQGANANAKSIKVGLTPLTIAAAVGNVEVVQLLLDAGADQAIPERSGDTALDRARQYEHPEVAALLEASEGASGS